MYLTRVDELMIKAESSDLATVLTIPGLLNASLLGGDISFCLFLWFRGTVPMVIGNNNLMSSL